jgi:hypothetical protein
MQGGGKGGEARGTRQGQAVLEFDEEQSADDACNPKPHSSCGANYFQDRANKTASTGGLYR